MSNFFKNFFKKSTSFYTRNTNKHTQRNNKLTHFLQSTTRRIWLLSEWERHKTQVDKNCINIQGKTVKVNEK